jgi:hypothetical protein
MHVNHNNDVIGFLSGSISGLTAYFIKYGPIMDFGIDLIKVIIFGFIGGIFGYLGKLFVSKYVKRHNSDDEL